MMLDYPSTAFRQSSGKAKQVKTEFHKLTFMKIRNSNQESTIPNLNRSGENRKRTSHK